MVGQLKKQRADLRSRCLPRCVSECVFQVYFLAATHPGGHASRRKPGNVVLKVNPPNPDHIHLVCWVIQGAEKDQFNLV